MSSFIEPADFVSDRSLLRIVSHVYADHKLNQQKKYTITAQELQTRYGIRIEAKKLKLKVKEIENQLENEDCELDYDSDTLRSEIVARYPPRIQNMNLPPINIPSSKPTSSSRLSNHFNLGYTSGNITPPPSNLPPSSSSGSTTPTGTDITRLKASVDRIANSFTSTVSILQSLQMDLHRIANALTGGERKGIVESIIALQQGINLDEDEQEDNDEEEERVTEPPTKKINTTTGTAARGAAGRKNSMKAESSSSSAVRDISSSPVPSISPSPVPSPVSTSDSTINPLSIEQEMTNAETAAKVKSSKRKHNAR